MESLTQKKKKTKFMTDISKYIESDDDIKESYDVYFNDEDANLILTNKKMLIASEVGLFRKSAKIKQDIPYTRIRSFNSEGERKLVLVNTNGTKFSYITRSPTARDIETRIKEIIKL